MAYGVDVIMKNYEILINFLNTRERLKRIVLNVDDELP